MAVSILERVPIISPKSTVPSQFFIFDSYEGRKNNLNCGSLYENGCYWGRKKKFISLLFSTSYRFDELMLTASLTVCSCAQHSPILWKSHRVSLHIIGGASSWFLLFPLSVPSSFSPSFPFSFSFSSASLTFSPITSFLTGWNIWYYLLKKTHV